MIDWESYKAANKDLTFEPLRSVVIDGHEVAWTRVRGNKYGNEGYFLICEHDANRHKLERPVRHGSEEDPLTCKYRYAAVELRVRELAKEYSGRIGDIERIFSTSKEQELELMIEVARRAWAGEWMGQTHSSVLYGQTVCEILQIPKDFMWEYLDELVTRNKIWLEGATMWPPRN